MNSTQVFVHEGPGVSYLSVSGPFLAMIILSLPSPPTGALSVPVVNCRNSLFCSSLKECNVSQKSLQRKLPKEFDLE